LNFMPETIPSQKTHYPYDYAFIVNPGLV
jgi:hypothetical protein